MRKKIKTSVIGSYPIQVNPLEMMHQYYQQQEILWEPYIDAAVQDMVKVGVDIVSDGQTRDPFIQLFTRKMGGCRVRARTEIIGPVEYCGPITIPDQKYVRQIIPKTTELIGVLTGPFTLMNSCVDLFYHDEKELAFAFASALRKEAEQLQHHVDLISIDEPFFSTSLPDYGKELLEVITKNISCPTRLHACGDVSKAVTQLVEMPVNILSHEFKASPFLFDVFKEYPGFSQQICLGCVRSDNDRVESVKEIVAHIEKGVEVFGEKIVQLSPDCGQRLLPRDIAFQKLRRLIQAGELYYGG